MSRATRRRAAVAFLLAVPVAAVLPFLDIGGAYEAARPVRVR